MTQEQSIDNKFVVQWDIGEVRFQSTAAANRFVERIGMKIAPTKTYAVLEVATPSM